MAKFLAVSLCLSVLVSLIFCSWAQNQTCSTYQFSSNRIFKSCTDLPVLDSFLHYTYDSSSGNLQIAFRHSGVNSRKWVAWAINPTSTSMVGAQVIIAYPQTDGTVRVYTTSITSYQPSLQESDLSFNVSDLSATYENSEIIIYANLLLPGNLALSGTVNTVWQDGSLSGDSPLPHPTSGPNDRSMSTLNLVSGLSGAVGVGSSKTKNRSIHGILNAVSWGIMMPIGVMIARYLRVFKSADPAWFYLHVFCQSSAYVIGVAGWATGLKLGSESAGVQYDTHRTIGITLFCLATLQAETRAQVQYHHMIGYGVIILGIVNIFEGFDILNPKKQWRTAYIGVIVALAIVAVLLEAFTWFVVIKRKKTEAAAKATHRGGANGAATATNNGRHQHA